MPAPLPTLDEVLAAAAVGESSDWEFKSAKGGLPRSLWETYSALAKTDGGVILLGAVEREDGVHLDGLAGPALAKIQKELWDNLNNRGKVSLNLLTNGEVTTLPVGGAGAHLLVLRVPRASRSQRPVHLGPNPLGNTYRRQHEGDYRCQDDEVRRMLADAAPEPADLQILEGYTLADLDAASLQQYRQRFSATKPGHPWLAFETKELLEKLGGWRRERVGSREGLTVAGLLMFGREAAIRAPEGRPQYHVDFREKLEPDRRWTDRLHPDGTWEANLFQFYQRVWPRLIRDLRVPFQLRDGVRSDDTPVHEALREALVNALIHADYTAPGGVVIERLPDRFILSNPGTLLVGWEQLRRGGVSECRNKMLQQMFQMIGGGERAGSGFDKIQSGWRSQHWRAPRLQEQAQPDRVMLEMPMVSLIPAETLTELRQRLGSALEQMAPAELQALATAVIEGEVSNARLQQLSNDHPTDISRMLAGLCERRLLTSDNRRRWTRYRMRGEDPLPLFPPSADKSAGDSAHLAGDSAHLLPESRPPVDPDGPEWLALQRVAGPVASKGRVAESVVTGAILALCRRHFVTVDQLARLLDRNPAALRARFVKPLVAAGRLLYRFPEAPNRPDQAYTEAVPPSAAALAVNPLSST